MVTCSTSSTGCMGVPLHLSPMLPDRVSRPPTDGGNWAAEYKWLGVRALCHVQDGRVRVTTRHGNEITGKYPELGRLAIALEGRQAVLDGTIVALDSDDHPDAIRLQHRIRAARLWDASPIAFVIFDLLGLDGRSLLRDAYAYRRLMLEQLKLNSPTWRTPPCFYGDPTTILEAARCLNLSGVIFKKLDGIYEPGVRSRSWLSLPLAAQRIVPPVAPAGTRLQALG